MMVKWLSLFVTTLISIEVKGERTVIKFSVQFIMIWLTYTTAFIKQLNFAYEELDQVMRFPLRICGETEI